MSKTYLWRALLLGSVAWGGCAGAAELTADPGAATVDPVVITARYKNENPQEVPIAVSTVSAAQIASVGGAFNLKQLQAYVPSLQIQGFSVRNQTITIRGLGTNAGQANEGLDQGVGIYIDGVYYARTGTALADLLDVESIQVLRGPQGTLFGKNTVAGAIDIRTRAPSLTEPEANGSLTFGNYNALRTEVSASTPINSIAALRLSVSANRRDGLVTNVRQDADWDNLNTNSVKADLVIKPSDALRVRLIGDYSQQKGEIGFTVVKSVLPTTLANGSTVRGFAARAADAGYVPTFSSDAFDRTTDIDGTHAQKLKTGGVSARVDRDLGALTLTSLSAYRFWNYAPNYDGDQTGADVMPRSTAAPRQKQFSQELRLTGKTATLDYTGGLYYFWQKSKVVQRTIYGSDAAKWYLGADAPDALLDGLEAYSYIDPETKSYAAYGQATWHALDRLSLTGGLRYTYETKSGSYTAEQRGTAADISTLPAAYQATAAATRASYAPSGGAYEASASNGNLSGTLSVNYDLTDDAHAYASYSRGYKSAGINLVRKSAGLDVFVDPEKVDAYELGLKTQLLDRRLELNTALFWTDVHDFQSNIYDVVNRISYISNVGHVRTRGVEVDARATPITGLTLTAAATYSDATYVSYTNALCPYLLSYKSACDISGRPLTGVSKWSGSLWGEYEHAVSSTLNGYVGADLTGRSSYYSTVNDDEFGRIPGYALVGVHAGVRVANGPWDVSVWARNLLDKNYYNTISVNSTTGLTTAVLGEPRTYGVTLRGKF